MAHQKVPENWQHLDWYIGPRQLFRLPGRRSPYNLFGLLGESTKEIGSARFIEPKDEPPVPPEQQKLARQSSILSWLLVPASFVIWNDLTKPGTGTHLFLQHYPVLLWLSWGVAIWFLVNLLLPTPEQEQWRKDNAGRLQRAMSSGIVEVELNISNGGGLWNTSPATTLTRRRGDPPKWSSELPQGRVLVRLEGLSADEAQRLYNHVSALHPGD